MSHHDRVEMEDSQSILYFPRRVWMHLGVFLRDNVGLLDGRKLELVVCLDRLICPSLEVYLNNKILHSLYNPCAAWRSFESPAQNAVRGLLHRDPAAALRKALKYPPIHCKDPAVKVH